MLNRNCKFLIFREIKKAPILKSVLLSGERVGMGRCRIKCGGMVGTMQGSRGAGCPGVGYCRMMVSSIAMMVRISSEWRWSSMLFSSMQLSACIR